MEKPKVAQKTPYVMDVEPGTYAWCACGLSNNQPYCDGSHKGTGFRPVIETIESAKKVAWCGCKHSGNVPFCDGSHVKIDD
ncbi:MAG: CDGSH iron-sulfur domain-containing protein [Bacteroidia bacterium]|nr:CDGSH iron-sulfur domain-containing protein [Bacteroidia bacterium]MBL4715946.1 CDGSH iron-sulfur domain-containing protein [Bacteroidia bacterium]